MATPSRRTLRGDLAREHGAVEGPGPQEQHEKARDHRGDDERVASRRRTHGPTPSRISPVRCVRPKGGKIARRNPRRRPGYGKPAGCCRSRGMDDGRVVRRPRVHRHRCRAGHRPRARADARGAGRQGRRQRPRRRRWTARAATPARPSEVVDEIKAMGGEAVANGDNVADWDGAERLVAAGRSTPSAASTSLVNNAGILRDRMLVNMTEAEWDAVIKVHLKGTSRRRATPPPTGASRSKAGDAGRRPHHQHASPSGIFGNVGQTNYGAAKAGIAAFTIIAALRARPLRRDRQRDRAGGAHPHDRGPRHGRGARRGRKEQIVAAVDRADRRVAGLARSRPDVTGRVFDVDRPARSSVAEGWHRGPTADDRSTTRRSWARSSPTSWPRPGPNADMSGNDRPTKQRLRSTPCR